MTAAAPLLSATLTFDDRAIESRVGLILLGTDHTTESDYARLVASSRIGVFATRIDYANPVTPDNLRAMEPHLAEAAARILPGDDLEAICFSCSSASVVIGDAAVEAAIRRGKPGVRVVTPPLATVAALKALGARRIAVLTPYTEETTRPMAAYFEGHGFEIATLSCLGLEDDREMARLSSASLLDAAAKATPRGCEALFISCTALRAAPLVGAIEREIGVSVVTSNQATAWACLHACEADPSPDLGAGRLFELTPSRLPGDTPWADPL